MEQVAILGNIKAWLGIAMLGDPSLNYGWTSFEQKGRIRWSSGSFHPLPLHDPKISLFLSMLYQQLSWCSIFQQAPTLFIPLTYLPQTCLFFQFLSLLSPSIPLKISTVSPAPHLSCLTPVGRQLSATSWVSILTFQMAYQITWLHTEKFNACVYLFAVLICLTSISV